MRHHPGGDEALQVHTRYLASVALLDSLASVGVVVPPTSLTDRVDLPGAAPKSVQRDVEMQGE
jgi:hypothetical protein